MSIKIEKGFIRMEIPKEKYNYSSFLKIYNFIENNDAKIVENFLIDNFDNCFIISLQNKKNLKTFYENLNTFYENL